MRDPDAAQAITAALWRAMLERGRGTVKQTEKAIGFRADGLRGAKNCKGGLRLRHVTDAIEALGIPPSVFFNDALGGGISTTAAERFMARGAELAARNLVELPDLTDDVQPDRLTEDDLARLDAARFEDPHAAADQAADVARQAARDGRRGDAVAAVARQGSALRVAEEWEAAWVCVWWALRTAPDAGMWQRAGSVVSDYGEFGDAAELAQIAAVAYMDKGEPDGVGRALVGRGIFLRRDDQHTTAIRILHAALSFLPDTESVGHVAVHQNLGLAFVALEDFTAAADSAQRAESVKGLPDSFSSLLRWLRARIAAGRRDFQNAEEIYEATIPALAVGDATLATSEVCRVFLETGQPAKANAVALGMARFAIPQGTNRIVAAAIADLYRTAQQGVLTLELAISAIRQIRQGLRRRASP